jgi:hypothetical protein
VRFRKVINLLPHHLKQHKNVIHGWAALAGHPSQDRLDVDAKGARRGMCIGVQF